MKKSTVRRRCVKKRDFTWGVEQQEAFEKVKHAIQNTAISGSDETLQYYLATEASEFTVGGYLFQTHGTQIGAEMGPKTQTER